MSVESNLFSAIIERNDWQKLVDKRITQDFFYGTYKQVFHFLQKHQMEYRQMPSKEIVCKQFPDFIFEGGLSEPTNYYLDEQRRKVKQNTLVDAINDASNALNNLDSDKALSSLRKVITKIDGDIEYTESITIGENTEQRLQEYYERQKSEGVLGQLMGDVVLDKAFGGLRDLDLMTLLCPTSKGKSWFACLTAVNMAKRGSKVLLCTKEMTPSQLFVRIDALASEVSFSRLRSGNLTSKEEEKFIHYIKEEAPKLKDNLIVELVEGGTSEVASLIDKYNPTVCIVDSAYLFVEKNSDDDWRDMVHIWRDFKQMARIKHIPFLLTSQLKGDKASLQNASFAKALANECDIVIGFQQSEEQKAEGEIETVALKVRDGEFFAPYIRHWTFGDTTDTSIIYQETPPQKQQIIVPTLQKIS